MPRFARARARGCSIRRALLTRRSTQGRAERRTVRDKALRKREINPTEGIKTGASVFLVLMGGLLVLLASAYFALTRLGA